MSTQKKFLGLFIKRYENNRIIFSFSVLLLTDEYYLVRTSLNVFLCDQFEGLEKLFSRRVVKDTNINESNENDYSFSYLERDIALELMKKCISIESADLDKILNKKNCEYISTSLYGREVNWCVINTHKESIMISKIEDDYYLVFINSVTWICDQIHGLEELLFELGYTDILKKD